MAKNLESSVAAPMFPTAMPTPAPGPAFAPYPQSGYPAAPFPPPSRFGPSPGPPPPPLQPTAYQQPPPSFQTAPYPNQQYAPGGFNRPQMNSAPYPPPGGGWSSPAPPIQIPWSPQGAPSAQAPFSPISTHAIMSSPPTIQHQPPVTGWPAPQPNINTSLTQSFNELSLSPVNSEPTRQYAAHRPSTSISSFAESSPKPGEPPSIVVPLPTIASLTAASPQVSSSPDPAQKIRWAKQVLALVDRLHQQRTGESAGSAQVTHERTPFAMTDPDLTKLIEKAIQYIVDISALGSSAQSAPPYVHEAIYLKGTLQASGFLPKYFSKDPRAAFKEFERAAWAGYHPGWFKLGRDYELVKDNTRAIECFDRGVKVRETSCLYVSVSNFAIFVLFAVN